MLHILSAMRNFGICFLFIGFNESKDQNRSDFGCVSEDISEGD